LQPFPDIRFLNINMFFRVLLGLAVATLARADSTVTFVNLDDQPRVITWTPNANEGYATPDSVTLSGAGATGSSMVTLNNGKWSGNAVAVNGTAATSYAGALVEFTFDESQQLVFWDVSWNVVANSGDPDPTGIKMMWPLDDTSNNSGCMTWNTTTGCTNAYYYNTGGGGYTRSSPVSSDFLVLVGTYGLVSEPQSTDFSDFTSMLPATAASTKRDDNRRRRRARRV
jgi:hypothetical protein